MRLTTRHSTIAILACAMALPAAGQTLSPAPANVQNPFLLPAPAPLSSAQFDLPVAPAVDAVEQLQSFKDSDVKFDLRGLMEILRDRRHEGWVLAAYPDPKTGRPLIGAGVSLDLPAREHQQLDPLNPHPFIEPSSAELWQAAGLDSGRLQAILDRFDDRLASWSTRGFRRRIKTLTPQITDDEATLLLRVSAIQAIYNAKGYCRDFDLLAPSQQMALTQLVYQMGVNLQEFSQFLTLINHYSDRAAADPASSSTDVIATDADYWNSVQQSLIQSQWARLYRARAVSVIAMLDPHYDDQARASEQRVSAILRPAVVHRRKGRSATSRQLASYAGRPGTGSPGKSHKGSPAHKSKLRSRKKRGV